MAVVKEFGGAKFWLSCACKASSTSHLFWFSSHWLTTVGWGLATMGNMTQMADCGMDRNAFSDDTPAALFIFGQASGMLTVIVMFIRLPQNRMGWGIVSRIPFLWDVHYQRATLQPTSLSPLARHDPY